MLKKLIIVAVLMFQGVCLAGMNPYIAGSLETVPTSGATLVFDDGNGFESPWAPKTDPGNWTGWDSGTPTSEGTIVHAGSVAMSTNAANEAMYFTIPAATDEIWVHWWVRFSNTIYNNVHMLMRVAETGGADTIWVSILNTDEIRVTDGTNENNTGFTPSIDTYYHFFVHLKAGADGSETVQFAANTSAAWDAWDFSTTATTIIPADFKTVYLGRLSAPSAEVFYFDGPAQIHTGAGMPAGWQ